MVITLETADNTRMKLYIAVSPFMGGNTHRNRACATTPDSIIHFGDRQMDSAKKDSNRPKKTSDKKDEKAIPDFVVDDPESACKRFEDLAKKALTTPKTPEP